MISKTAMTYGGALYDLAREESLEEQILGELHAVSDLFRQNPDYTKLLMEPSIEKPGAREAHRRSVGRQCPIPIRRTL